MRDHSLKRNFRLVTILVEKSGHTAYEDVLKPFLRPWLLLPNMSPQGTLEAKKSTEETEEKIHLLCFRANDRRVRDLKNDWRVDHILSC